MARYSATAARARLRSSINQYNTAVRRFNQQVRLNQQRRRQAIQQYNAGVRRYNAAIRHLGRR